MFSETLRNLRRPLALRLTLWYAGVFAASSVLAFTIVYLFFVSIVRQRTDDDLREDIGEYGTFMKGGGLDRVRSEIAVETQSAAQDVSFELWGPEGSRILVAGFADTTPHRGLEPDDQEKEPTLATIRVPGVEHRVRVVEGGIAPGYVMRIGQSLEEDDAFIADFRNGFLITLAAVMFLGAPIGWFLARRALRPVQELTRAATEIADGALDRRVPMRSDADELGVLARAFNTMLDRIQALIVAMREMTDNMAHDLRSPLARIRTSSEMAMANGESKTDLATTTIEECDRLMEMIDTTLDIAEAESGAARLNLAEVDLADLVLDACDVFKTAAEDRHVTITSEVPGPCAVRGDRHRLQRILANLLDNALKYTPPEGSINVRLQDDGKRVKLAVLDTGIGIPADELPRIFQRFYRGDRSRSGNGNGLGLSLALAFARAHGGDITAESAPGRGSTFTVVLPRAR